MKEIQYWLEHNLRNYQSKNVPITDFQVDHIIDWLKSDDAIRHRKRIARLSVPDAIKLSDLWSLKLNKKATIDEKASDVEVLYFFDDGHKIVKLLTEQAYLREGKLMSHCVASYFDKECTILSFRDQKNNPICTLELRDVVVQGRGFANAILDKKYNKYIIEYFKNNYRDIFLNSSFYVLNSLGIFSDIDYIKKYFIELILKLSYRDLYDIGLFKNEECTELILFWDLKYKNWVYYNDVDLSECKLTEIPRINCRGMLDLTGNQINELPEWIFCNRTIVRKKGKIVFEHRKNNNNLEYIGSLNLNRNPIANNYIPNGITLIDHFEHPFTPFIISFYSKESLRELYNAYIFIIRNADSLVEILFKNQLQPYRNVIKNNCLLKEFLLKRINTRGIQAHNFYGWVDTYYRQHLEGRAFLTEIDEYLSGNAALLDFSDELKFKNNLIAINDIDMSLFNVLEAHISKIESNIQQKGLQNYVIAGEAISNIIYAARTGCKPVVNEIDVFVLVPSDLKVIVAKDGIADYRYGDCAPLTSADAKIVVYPRIKILKKEHCCDINYIYIEASDSFSLNDVSVEYLISTFEFNCDQVLYKAGEIRCSTAFSNFLQNKMIMMLTGDNIIENCNILCKKIKEMPGSFVSLHEIIFEHTFESEGKDSVWRNDGKLDYGSVDGILNLLNLNNNDFRKYLMENYNRRSLVSLYYAKGFIEVGCEYNDVLAGLNQPMMLVGSCRYVGEPLTISQYLQQGLECFGYKKLMEYQYKCRVMGYYFVAGDFGLTGSEKEIFDGIVSKFKLKNKEIENQCEYDLDAVSELMENAFDF